MPINLAEPGRPVRAGIILLDSVTEVLDVAPIDLLNGVSKNFACSFPDEVISPELKAKAIDVEFHWVNESGKKPGRLTSGLSVNITDSMATCPPLDVVIMGAAEPNYVPTAGELEYLRKVYAECTAFISVCGGFQAALAAGLLKGRRATAPRFLLPMLRQSNPEVEWMERRWVNDDKMWTSGALLNGLDLIRAFGEKYWPEKGSILGLMLEIGSFPKRDLEYRDGP